MIPMSRSKLREDFWRRERNTYRRERLKIVGGALLLVAALGALAIWLGGRP